MSDYLVKLAKVGIMKKELLLTDKFWSAVKRKQLQEVLEIVFESIGEDKAAEVAGGVTRMTDLAIQKMRTALSENVEDVEDVEETDAAELTYNDDVVTEVGETFKAIEKAIEKGKGKKALKLIKQAKEDGIDGSVLKDLKKLAKEL